MAQNDETGGSDYRSSDDYRGHNLFDDEVRLIERYELLVPPDYRIPMGWHLKWWWIGRAHV